MSSGRLARGTAIVFGLVAIVAIPVAIGLAIFLPSIEILPALVAGVPTAFVCGLVGLSASRRARFKVDRSVHRAGERSVRFGRMLGWTGLYVAVVGALSLGVYSILHASS